jgi:hypothetical protein
LRHCLGILSAWMSSANYLSMLLDFLVPLHISKTMFISLRTWSNKELATVTSRSRNLNSGFVIDYAVLFSKSSWPGNLSIIFSMRFCKIPNQFPPLWSLSPTDRSSPVP